MNIQFDQTDQQQIELNTNDPRQFTHLISHHDVDIQLTNRTHLLPETKTTHHVNQVFSQPIIDHQWEPRYHPGHLIVTCGDFVAYALKPQSGDDIVCVFYKQVDFRSVINPPFSGDIHDLAFSFSTDLLLACVDQASHLRIYRLEKIDELEHTLILFVDLQYTNDLSPPIVSWCCFIPDSSDADDSDAYTMMSITRGSDVEVLNVAIASQSFISEEMLTLNQIENGRLTFDDNSGNVTCVCFSPDGTALGTGTDTGEIKFFSINFDQPATCRCLHLWIPHEGRSISSLFFLDDHKHLTQDTQLWRYAISGCDQNREFKVWSCTNWSCLQVIRFEYSLVDSAFHPVTPFPVLQASIDLTSRFLVLSDIHRNCFYVLTIYQDAENNRAHFSSINAFPTINSPSLSFAIIAADRLNSSDDQNQFSSHAVKMYSIHTKCFQEILLVFQTRDFITTGTLLDEIHFEPYIAQLRAEGLPTSSMNNHRSTISQPLTNPTYSIDDLLTPNGEANRRSLHSGTNPLHGLLLGHTTAFDTVPVHPSPLDDKKDLDQDEPVNFKDNAHWTDNCHSAGESPMKRLNTSDRQDINDYSDPTETSDKDDDSTADEEELPSHSRPKRRPARSPNTSQISFNADSLHEIRQLTHLLAELRGQADPGLTGRAQSNYEMKLEQCCQRLDQLTNKVDRLVSFEQSGVVSRPSRPSPNAAPVEVLTPHDPQSTLSDVHYDRLEAILMEKIQSYLQASMNSAFEPYQDLKDNLHKDLSAKLLATDSVMKQSMTQIFRSKNMVDSLSHAVANAIQSTMVSTYRDTFNQSVIPSFEKAATNMFQQTNDVFKRGTKEYLQEMIEYGRQQQRTLIQQREQMMGEIRKETSQLTKEFEKKNQEFSQTLKSELTQYLNTHLTSLIRETSQTVLRDETTRVFQDLLTEQKNDLQTLLRSSTNVTPVPTADVKQSHVLKLVQQGHLNQAFEFVLSAADLSLVLYLCEHVRAKELFSLQPCPLQTPVLLSLIQQLSADLLTHQDLKHSYLHEALLCLDPSTVQRRENLQRVLMDLSQKLSLVIQTHPSSPLTQRFQLLWMTSQGLLQKLSQLRTTPIGPK